MTVSLYLLNSAPMWKNNPVIWTGIATGMASIVAGVFKRKEYMRIFAIGVSDKVEFQGKRNNLDDLFRTIRQKKEQVTSTLV